MICTRSWRKGISISRMMKRQLLFLKGVLPILAVLLLAGCQVLPEKEEGPLKVGLLLTTSPDEAYSEGYYGYQALKALESGYGVEIAYNENVASPDNAGFLLNSYGKNGYDLVIGIGELFMIPMLNAGPSYPQTTFICINGQESGENVHSYDLPDDTIAFLAGAIAASGSPGPSVGYVLKEGMEVYYEEFLRGVRSVRPDGTAEVFWVQSALSFKELVANLKSAGIQSAALYYNSPELEKLLTDAGIATSVIGGYKGLEDQSRLQLPRVAYDYTVMVDQVFKDFQKGAYGENRDILGFQNRSVYVDSLGLLGERERLNLEGLVKTFQ